MNLEKGKETKIAGWGDTEEAGQLIRDAILRAEEADKGVKLLTKG